MKNFLSFEDNGWWEEFLKDPVKIVRKNIRWPLSHLRKVYKKSVTPSQTTDENSSVTEMIEIEQTSREVFIEVFN